MVEKVNFIIHNLDRFLEILDRDMAQQFFLQMRKELFCLFGQKQPSQVFGDYSSAPNLA